MKTILKAGLTVSYVLLIVILAVSGFSFIGMLAGNLILGAAIIGTRTTANTSSDIHVRNVENIMPYIWRNQSPITQFFITKDIRQEMTDGKDSAFEHFEKDQRANSATLTTGLTGGANTEATVAVSEDIFRINDTVIVDSTSDFLDVTAIATGTINLRRVGGGNITAASSLSSIRRLAPSFSDKFVKQESYSNTPDGKTGYCQIMLEALDMTGREQAAKKYGGNEDWDVLFEETGANMMYDQDQAWLYNDAAIKETLSDGVRTKSAGFRGSVTSNVNEWSGALDMDEVDDMLEMFMIRGVKGYSNEWIGWAGTKYVRALNKALKAERNWQQSDSDKKEAIIRIYGGLHKGGANPEIFKYNAPFGTVYYMWNPNMVDKWSNSCLYTHPQCIKMRYMDKDKNGPRKYRVEENVQTPGAGNKHDQILSDVGLHIKTEKLMGWHNKEV